MRFPSIVLGSLALSAVALVSCANARVQLKVGDASPTWKNLAGVDGKEHSFDEFKKAKLIVVIFTCNNCPVAQSYVKRLSELNTHFEKSDVSFVAINPNKDEDLKAMKEYAKQQKITHAYLRDETQKVAKSFGARATPEVFVLDKARKVAYMGAIDDDVMLKGIAKRHYLKDAIEAILAGKQPPKTTTKAVGCAIRWK